MNSKLNKSECAIILGNGESRLNIELPELVRTYGCNAIYRDQKVDDLIVVDPAIQHEIYSSGYVMDRRCWFASWSPVHNSREVKALMEFTPADNIIQNKRTTDLCSIAGMGEKFYITWILDKDMVTNIGSIDKSSGEVAIEMAIKHKKKHIFMLGFDGGGNIYRGTDHYYDEDGPYDEWYDGHEDIYNKNPDVTFYRVNCNMQESLMPNCLHIDNETFRELLP